MAPQKSKSDGLLNRPAHCLGRAAVSVLVAVFMLTPWLTLAAEEPAHGSFSLVLENDFFYKSDHYYTSGIRTSWLSSANRQPDWELRAARWFPLFPADGTVRTCYAVGQNIYTPYDITLQDPPLDDRPYGGWLYGSVEVIAETGRRLDQLELTVGVVGLPLKQNRRRNLFTRS